MFHCISSISFSIICNFFLFVPNFVTQNAMAQAALQAAQSMMPLQTGHHHHQTSPPVVTDTGGGPNRVLLVTVENMLYPVTLNDLHQVFSRCGTVLKIVTFNKSSEYEAIGMLCFVVWKFRLMKENHVRWLPYEFSFLPTMYFSSQKCAVKSLN